MVIEIKVAVGNIQEAQKIAYNLVENQLAACVQIIPQIESIYRWENEICREDEVLIYIKTVSSLFDRIERQIKSIHSYTTPEIIATRLEFISENYHHWLLQNINFDRD